MAIKFAKFEAVRVIVGLGLTRDATEPTWVNPENVVAVRLDDDRAYTSLFFKGGGMMRVTGTVPAAIESLRSAQ